MINISFALTEALTALREAFNPSAVVWYRGNEHNEAFGPTDTDGTTRHYNELGPGWYYTTSEANAAQYGRNIKQVRLSPSARVFGPKKRTNLGVVEAIVKASPSFEFNITDWDTVGEGNPRLGMRAFLSQINKTDMFDACQDAMVNFYRSSPDEFVAQMGKHFDAYVTGPMNSILTTGEGEIRHMVLYNQQAVTPVA